MANQTTLQNFRELGNTAFREVYGPVLKEVKNNPDQSRMLADCPRTSEGVRNRKVKNGFVTSMPHVWGGFDKRGGTFPLGGTFEIATQEIELASFAATAMITHADIDDTNDDANAMGDLLALRLNALVKTLPTFRTALFLSPVGTKAIGKAASISGTAVTLDNAGLWHTGVLNRSMLFERGQYIQWYRSAGVKVGGVTRVQAVNYLTGVVTLDQDPGIQDNDYAVLTDPGGYTETATSAYYGLLDALDDDNTFQGMDRSTAANYAFRAYLESASGKSFAYPLLSDFFTKLRNPEKAYIHPSMITNYWEFNLASQVRFDASAKVFNEGFQEVLIDRTRLVGDDKAFTDKLVVPNYGKTGLMIKTSGAPRDPFGHGWHQIGRAAAEEFNMVFDEQLVMMETPELAGILHTISARTS